MLLEKRVGFIRNNFTWCNDPSNKRPGGLLFSMINESGMTEGYKLLCGATIAGGQTYQAACQSEKDV